MKKIKLAIMVTAILLSVGGAFATKLNQACAGAPQYRVMGGGMVPAGTMGWDYYCATDNSNTCTYYQVAGGYAACQLGVWTVILH